MRTIATFSIVAYDPAREEWGVAVQSKFLAAAAVVSWARAGAGAVATQAHHTGQLSGQTVRVRSAIDIRVAHEGWVRCDLGRVPDALGKVLVDGKPGWLLVDSPAAQGGKPAQEAPPKKQASPQPRAYLLVQGPGVFRAEIEFSLRATKSEDLWSLAGVLPGDRPDAVGPTPLELFDRLGVRLAMPRTGTEVAVAQAVQQPVDRRQRAQHVEFFGQDALKVLAPQ